MPLALLPSASDFALKPPDCPDTEFPVRIAHSDRGCLWYKKDNKFKIPKGEARLSPPPPPVSTRGAASASSRGCFLSPAAAYIRFHIVSPVVQQSARK